MRHARYTAILTALLLAASLTACSGKTDDTASVTDTVPAETAAETEASTEAPTQAETESTTETEPATEEIPTEPAHTETAELTFLPHTLIEETYDITMPYADPTLPQAAQYNALIDAKIRQMIGFCEELTSEEEGITCTLNAEYRITRDDAQYLSIVWEGMWYVSRAAHPNHFIEALIIDKTTMTEVTLTDLYTVDEAFTQMVQAHVDAQLQDALAEKLGVPPEEFEGVAASVTLEGLQASGKQFDYGHTAFLTEDGLGVSVYVPHAIGDHCEIVIPYADLS